MAEKVLVELKNISKTFPGVKALDNINFSISKASVHGLVGENGSGKSTLIKILSGVYSPDPGGEIIIDGENVGQLTPIISLKKGLAVTYQDFSLFPNLTVAENIGILKTIEKNKQLINWVQIKRNAKEAIRRIGVDINIDTLLGSLSSAKQQLVAIARALVYNTKLLILDEPTSSLSSSEVETLFSIIKKIKNEGMSVLFISHKIDEIFRVCDIITVIRDGSYIGSYKIDEISYGKIIEKMVGRDVEYMRKENPARTNVKLLEVENLTKAGNYSDVSFTLYKGEIIGVTGLVGAGRTELCQSIFGITHYDSGRILLEGKEISIKNTEDARKLGMAFVPENRLLEGLILRQNVESNLTMTALDSLTNNFKLVNNRKLKSTAINLINRFKIKPAYPQIQVVKLSGGNQQRVSIAKWLINDPKILIIDEPTNGIDVGAKEEIHNLLLLLVKQGIGIIMISSELQEILAISDRIFVMRRGRIAAQYDGKNAKQEDIMKSALLKIN